MGDVPSVRGDVGLAVVVRLRCAKEVSAESDSLFSWVEFIFARCGTKVGGYGEDWG